MIGGFCRGGGIRTRDVGDRACRVASSPLWAITKCGKTPTSRGLLQAFPYLKQFGVSDKRLIYKFDFNGARFIFLWTGKYDYRSPSSWDADRPQYEAQMKELKTWLDEAKASGIRKVFISLHNPIFARSGMGPIPEAQNPHKVI